MCKNDLQKKAVEFIVEINAAGNIELSQEMEIKLHIPDTISVFILRYLKAKIS